MNSELSVEYQALSQSCALAARPERKFVLLTGERPAEMLNGLITNDVSTLERVGQFALLLNAKGRVLSDLRIFRSPEGLLVDAPDSATPEVLATFKKYIPPLYAVFEDVSERIGLCGVYGPESASAVAEALDVEIPEEALGAAQNEHGGAPYLLVRERRFAVDGVECIASREVLEELAAACGSAIEARGGRRVGHDALEVLRIEAGLPLYGVDMTQENLPQETGLDDAISFQKGCYLGQEVVARIHYRGHVNRHLRVLGFADELPPRGAELIAGDKKVGAVTSTVASPRFGPIGLGYVRREVEPGRTIRWSNEAKAGDAEVRAEPFRRL